MLYDSSESCNISICKEKKSLHIKTVDLESDLQLSRKSRTLLTGWSRMRDLADATVHTGQMMPKHPANSKSDHLGSSINLVNWHITLILPCQPRLWVLLWFLTPLETGASWGHQGWPSVNVLLLQAAEMSTPCTCPHVVKPYKVEVLNAYCTDGLRNGGPEKVRGLVQVYPAHQWQVWSWHPP